jgi:hypothetical protein
LFQGGNVIKDLISDPLWVDFMDKRGKGSFDPTKNEPQFEQWTLPGGENYYEIVLTATGPELKDKHRETVFTEGHHNVDNAVAHMRLKTRIDTEGRRILFVEEIQSDWHQQGRKRGYSKEENAAIVAALEKKVRDAQREVSIRRSDPRLKGGIQGFERDLKKLEDKLHTARKGPVADGPFKKTQEWAGLAVRRLLREAAEGGYDGVAFTTGDSVYELMEGKLEGQRKFYDEILPSIVKKESKSKLGKTQISIDYGAEGTAEYEYLRTRGMEGIAPPTITEFNFLELTPKVKARGMKPQKLFEVLIGASAIPAAAALMGEEEEELKRADQ